MMSVERRCAAWLLRGTERLIPPPKADWARAMVAESAHLPDDWTALTFAAGCARAAGTERMRTLVPDKAWFWPGAAFGVLLLASALVPGSRELPLLWAPLAGVLAVLMLRDGHSRSFLSVVTIAFKTGALIGLLFFSVGILLLLAAPDPLAMERAARFIAAALAVIFLATTGGAAVAPLVCRPPADPLKDVWEEVR